MVAGVAVCPTMRSSRRGMIRISVTQVAFDAIANTLPLGSVAYEDEPNENGQRVIWVEARVVDKLTAPRRPSESWSEVILRLVEIEAKGRR
jgi:hypothetical protein